VTLYECPECGHLESDSYWDAADRAENGMPSCPYPLRHGRVEMELREYVPRSLAVELAEALIDSRKDATAALSKARDAGLLGTDG
jgi:hypothetical protein